MKKILFIIPIFLLLAAGCSNTKNSTSDISSNELIVYPVYCKDVDTTDFQNCSQKEAQTRSEFKIDTANQKVIWWSLDDKTPSFQTLTDCSIVDLNNWSCNINGNSGLLYKFGFNKGNYFNSANTKHNFFVSKDEWDSINNGKISK
jgi:hypothetical protein